MNLAVLTVSDTRTLADDRSGGYLAHALQEASHTLHEHAIVADDIAAIRARICAWRDAGDVDAVIMTGGTGITGRDLTPEALDPLWTRQLPGFGELFRWLSYADIGAATIQSRACAGVVGAMLVFCLPGSTGACELGWSKILHSQLDPETRPCNFAMLMPRLREV